MNKQISFRLLVHFMLLLMVFICSCSLQKRRYHKGFYVTKGSHQKVNNYHKIDEQSAVKTIATNATKRDIVSIVEDKIESGDNVALEKEKLPNFNKKRLIYINDTITNKHEKSVVQEKNIPAKPKAELFSILALIAFIFSLVISIAIIWIAIAYTFPEILLLLLFINIFTPIIGFLLSIEGDFRTQKNPEKFKHIFLSKIIMIVSILLGLLNAFLFTIYLMAQGAVVVW